MMNLINFLPAVFLMGCSVVGHAGPDSPMNNSNSRSGGILQGVVGRVIDGKNNPVEGALIQPKSLDSPSSAIPEIAILSDGNGHYQWPLVPGSYEVSASANGYQTAAKRVVFKAGEVVQADFRLVEAP